MPKRAPGLKEIGDWRPTKNVYAWCEKNHPAVDIEGTAEVFIRWAKKNGYMYKDWSLAFYDWVDDRNGYGGKVYRPGFGPGDNELIKEARELGFRAKDPMETVEQYRTALRQYEPPKQCDMADVISGLFESKR